MTEMRAVKEEKNTATILRIEFQIKTTKLRAVGLCNEIRAAAADTRRASEKEARAEARVMVQIVVVAVAAVVAAAIAVDESE